MNTSIEMLLLSIKEDSSDEEKQKVRDYNIKYALVRYLYAEVMSMEAKEGEPKLVDFHFTPGKTFMETPVIRIVNDLMNIDFSKAKPMLWDDLPKNKST